MISPVLISLIGLMGSGKTTLGRALSRRLALSFYDSDAVIEARLGCAIGAYFAREGEERFRDMEQKVIEELTLRNRAVLATGGGACLRLANREHLNTRSHCIYLDARPEELSRRLSHDVSRPLLQGGDVLATLRALYEVRHPLYVQTAHACFATSQFSAAHLLRQIIHHLERHGVI